MNSIQAQLNRLMGLSPALPQYDFGQVARDYREAMELEAAEEAEKDAAAKAERDHEARIDGMWQAIAERENDDE